MHGLETIKALNEKRTSERRRKTTAIPSWEDVQHENASEAANDNNDGLFLGTAGRQDGDGLAASTSWQEGSPATPAI